MGYPERGSRAIGELGSGPDSGCSPANLDRFCRSRLTETGQINSTRLRAISRSDRPACEC